MEPVEEIRRENLAALVAAYGSQRLLADAIKKAPAQISQWITRAPNSGTGKPRVVSSEAAREIEARLGKDRGWMDHRHSEPPSSVAKTPSDDASTVSLFTQERREDDNVKALQIAIRAVARTLLPKERGAAREFLAVLTALCREKNFSPDHYLLGQLSDIAEQVQIDEEAATREQSRVGTGRHTKQGT